MDYVSYGLKELWRRMGNLRRRLVRAPEFVLFLLEGAYPDLPPAGGRWRRWMGGASVSLEELGRRLEQVAADGRVRGVVFQLGRLRLSAAQVEALRDEFRRLRQAGKRVVVWATEYETAEYWLACAADEILLQPGGTVGPLGLRQEYVFLAEALEALGLQGDFVQISPYKTASDKFTRTELSEEARAMAEWLAESYFRELLDAIREGRGLDEAGAQALVDSTPLTDEQARARGVVDGLLNAEELPAHLGRDGKPVSLLPWEAAARRLLRPPLPRPGRYVARIRIEGTIVDGWSRRPPVRLPLPLVGDPQTGDLSIVQQARRVAEDRRAVALLLHVDSGGGSATASEAMASALAQVAARKPVVAVMGDVAASGGYYVTTPAHWVVARPGTLTGSIGVLAGKFVDRGFTRKLRTHRQAVTRGRNISLYQPDRPFSEEERGWVWSMIQRTYDLFCRRVASARKLAVEAVDRVGGGRVWTGRQALEHRLVDEMGGTRQALAKALELAGVRGPLAIRDCPEDRRLAALQGAAAGIEGAAPLLDGIRSLFRAGAPLLLTPIIWRPGPTRE
ncbi:MAG TPA: signal peptide peptidase SppA [Limnochorda sp.]